MLAAFRQKTDAELPREGIRWTDGHSADDRLVGFVPMVLEDVSVWTALELFCNVAGWDFDCAAKRVELRPLARENAAVSKGSSRFTTKEVRRMQDPDGLQAMRMTIRTLFAGWRMCATLEYGTFGRSRRQGKSDAGPLGYVAEYRGRTDVLRTCGEGNVMECVFDSPVKAGKSLRFWASGDPDTQILVTVDGNRTFYDCGTLDISGWRFYDVDLSRLKGKRLTLAIAVRGRSGEPCVMQWHGISVR